MFATCNPLFKYKNQSLKCIVNPRRILSIILRKAECKDRYKIHFSANRQPPYTMKDFLLAALKLTLHTRSLLMLALLLTTSHLYRARVLPLHLILLLLLL